MKTLGLIGGTSWLSTVEYYSIINRRINERLGGLHSAKMFLYSMDFEEFKPPPDPAEWGGVAMLLSDIGLRLQRAGAECIVICANAPHMVAGEVQSRIGIPLIHVAEATAGEIARCNLKSVGLLGTRIVMEQPFFKERLAACGVGVMTPGERDREFIHESIFSELTRGIFRDATRERYLAVINELVGLGAEGIVLGCTEIPLLMGRESRGVPLFDTTRIHAEAAVDFALQK